ncbi:hypothetical protein [Nocardioides panzhihuensis]|uniref:Uncharacterized protein n=1 Tax=Nocardioides panzhihuensis TaxID=860243 RepID=A0A7Z0DH51_9ACTN|nr:hypothetical protein [Nocardioides panzhihuensis]NYI75491.1 hypothetical protein [Nocardioides panzhihuensis]
MSVADRFGLDDPDSPLLVEAAEGWRRWCALDPQLAVVDELRDLRVWTKRASREDKDRVLASVAALTERDRSAVAALVWLLIPGASRLAQSLQDLTADIDDVVAGELWIQAAQAHQLGTRGLAQTILYETRRAVLRGLDVGAHAEKTWSQTRTLDDLDEGALGARADLHEDPVADEVTEPVLDSAAEVVEFLKAAGCDRALGWWDVWLVHELAVAADEIGAPLHRGRFGLTTPAAVAKVAALCGKSERTVRRRACQALDALAEYAAAQVDETRLARWRSEHPEVLPTWQQLAREEAWVDETYGSSA